MRRYIIALTFIVLMLLATMPALAQEAHPTHLVLTGQTLGQIAAHYNTTPAAIMAANNISNPNLIFVGQVLDIPPAEFGTGGPVAAPANTSPPKPQDAGKVIHSTLATAIAASNALPPRCKMPKPAATARGEADATIPFVP